MIIRWYKKVENGTSWPQSQFYSQPHLFKMMRTRRKRNRSRNNDAKRWKMAKFCHSFTPSLTSLKWWGESKARVTFLLNCLKPIREFFVCLCYSSNFQRIWKRIICKKIAEEPLTQKTLTDWKIVIGENSVKTSARLSPIELLQHNKTLMKRDFFKGQYHNCLLQN